jgi:hypothetical protein
MENTSVAQRWVRSPISGQEVAVALLYAFVGVVIAANFEPLRFFGYRWYQSWWFPLATACLLFAAVAIWLRMSRLKASLFGLLITAPPYSRWLLLVVETYLNPGAGNSVTAFRDYVGPMAVSSVLMLSGAFLNPLISGTVRHILRRFNAT